MVEIHYNLASDYKWPFKVNLQPFFTSSDKKSGKGYLSCAHGTNHEIWSHHWRNISMENGAKRLLISLAFSTWFKRSLATNKEVYNEKLLPNRIPNFARLSKQTPQINSKKRLSARWENLNVVSYQITVHDKKSLRVLFGKDLKIMFSRSLLFGTFT